MFGQGKIEMTIAFLESYSDSFSSIYVYLYNSSMFSGKLMNFEIVLFTFATSWLHKIV